MLFVSRFPRFQQATNLNFLLQQIRTRNLHPPSLNSPFDEKEVLGLRLMIAGWGYQELLIVLISHWHLNMKLF